MIHHRINSEGCSFCSVFFAYKEAVLNPQKIQKHTWEGWRATGRNTGSLSTAAGHPLWGGQRLGPAGHLHTCTPPRLMEGYWMLEVKMSSVHNLVSRCVNSQGVRCISAGHPAPEFCPWALQKPGVQPSVCSPAPGRQELGSNPHMERCVKPRVCRTQ